MTLLVCNFFLDLDFLKIFLEGGQQCWALWAFLAACPCIDVISLIINWANKDACLLACNKFRLCFAADWEDCGRRARSVKCWVLSLLSMWFSCESASGHAARGETATAGEFQQPTTASNSAVADRPRVDLCPSVVSLNKIITRADSFNIVAWASHLPLRNVVFGVPLRLLVIHFVVVSRHQQTRPLTSD